ncbi:MAG: hypothetical protein KAY06_10155, partial [Aeromonadaceae bacterium]|nr:hypothetical protein [Aeromonadaceae bacterium]
LVIVPGRLYTGPICINCFKLSTDPHIFRDYFRSFCAMSHGCHRWRGQKKSAESVAIQITVPPISARHRGPSAEKLTGTQMHQPERHKGQQTGL